ncbi:MAG TPA: phosphatidylinositol-specific phospholipase C/glycerophosphodiester phosphodiesterase family protein [Candidatus Limnocylindria bacterium]|nr:phosphatidylinositol-specific phospholipase C/glycerophosphodiester phosphodiesterase family protein [Candidatus Limnocylindria bacterium]
MNSARVVASLVRAAALALAGAVLASGAAADPVAKPPVPLHRAHAHNDYEHTRPLLDALDQGFCSVEADIYLVDGQLLVAHDRKDLKPGRTLQALYLDPLRDRVRANGGHVYPGLRAVQNIEFIQLVDIKTDGPAVYAKLREVLAGYADMLTHFTPTNTTTGAITVILTGDRPADLVAADPQRLCAVDGHFSDLEANTSVNLVPLVSESWQPTFNWFKDEQLAAPDRAKLHEIVTKAHAQGRLIRFWGVQDKLFVWRELYAAKVDLLNTDNLAGLAEFLHAQR